MERILLCLAFFLLGVRLLYRHRRKSSSLESTAWWLQEALHCVRNRLAGWRWPLTGLASYLSLFPLSALRYRCRRALVESPPPLGIGSAHLPNWNQSYNLIRALFSRTNRASTPHDDSGFLGKSPEPNDVVYMPTMSLFVAEKEWDGSNSPSLRYSWWILSRNYCRLTLCGSLLGGWNCAG